ncbi:MAG: hypothetical protein ISS69_12095 [Phycisphaerae bacterium]|nr:hypothetical protein [Phycisphaerae bacterium]
MVASLTACMHAGGVSECIRALGAAKPLECVEDVDCAHSGARGATGQFGGMAAI